MKYLLLCFVLTALRSNGQLHTGNPSYDFPDSLIISNGNGFGHLNAKLDDLSVSGYYRESRAYQDSMDLSKPIYLTLNNKRMVDARKLILNEAKKYRILLINEAHHRPEHRLFTKSLLPGLMAIGYNVFMAEGLQFESAVNKRSYPIRNDGTYLSEPAYGSLIRYARKLNYEIGTYEYHKQKPWDDTIKLDKYGSVKYISYNPRDSAELIFDENGLKYTKFTSVRERGQAAHIVDMIKKHPKSKFIIHVGYGHLYENGPMMGAKLRELLNWEDVLTIDQTMMPDGTPLIDSVTNNTISGHFPFLLQDSITNRFFKPDIAVDYSIIGNTIRDSLNRPGYLFEDIEQRTVYNIPVNMQKDCPCLFAAYYQNEFEKEKEQAVAADIVYINGTIKPLLLNKGRYVIIKKNKKGKFQQFNIGTIPAGHYSSKQ